MHTRAILLASSLMAMQLSATAEEIEQPLAEKVAVLQDKRIHESSGLARSRRHPGIFWTHNDSGGEPCLFAINRKGETVAKVRVPKAANFDWEDLTTGPDEEGRPCLFIGDIGDNFRIRATLQIYRIPEPDLPADATKETESEEPVIWHLSYPKGRFNAESLMMHPLTLELYVLTKDEKGDSTLYRVPTSRSPGQGLILEKVVDLHFPEKVRVGKRPGMACQTSSADFSPDGQRLVIATYSYLHEWKLPPGKPLAEVLAQPAHLILPPLTKQMEAVCYDEKGGGLWFTSEQLPTPLYRLKRK